MKKIAVVALGVNPSRGSEAGRASMWINILSKYYAMDVYVDEMHKKDIVSKSYENIDFHFIPGLRNWRRFSGKTKTGIIMPASIFFRKVKKLLNKRRDRYSLIHCLTPAGVYAFNTLWKLEIPILVGPLGGGLPTPRGFRHYFGWRNIARDVFYKSIPVLPLWKKYFLNADRIIIGTELLLEILPAQVQEKSDIIPDAVVDAEYFKPLKKKQSTDQKRILFAGGLVPKKGPGLLIEAARRCVQVGVNNFLIEMAGEGQLKPQLNELVKAYALEGQIRILGRLKKKELLERYQNSDIFCLPTLREPGGNVILEAMSCGLPIISSNYGGPAYSVTKDCGILIEVGNYEQYVSDLAEAITYLIKNDDIRKQMGENARRRAVTEFSVDALEKKILKVYGEILEKTNLNENPRAN